MCQNQRIHTKPTMYVFGDTCVIQTYKTDFTLLEV